MAGQFVVRVAGHESLRTGSLEEAVRWARRHTGDAWVELPGLRFNVEIFHEQHICTVVAKAPPPFVVDVEMDPEAVGTWIVPPCEP